VLIIDDEPDVLLTLAEHAFADAGVEFLVARTGEEGLRHVEIEPPDAILLDVMLPDIPGLDVFQRMRLIGVNTPVIFTTLSTATETAIEAMKLGALEYLFKPIDLEHLRRVLGQALEMSHARPETTTVAPLGLEETEELIVGCSPVMREVYKSIGRVASQDVIVLVTGESGTGKELVAQAIHQHSTRAHEPFIALNCAAIPDSLLESELFGHERGAFTGADRRRIGKFEQCNGGTLFLDEIGDMSLVTQARILRLLQDQTFQRIGGTETIRTNVRLVTATNRDLGSMVTHGLFRADLFYRLNVFSIELPPLRLRGGDLALLTRHFLRRFNRQLGRNVQDIRKDAMEILENYNWPGNVRELQSVLKQSLLNAPVSHGDVLLPSYLPDYLQNPESVFGPIASVEAVAVPRESGDGELDRFIRERLNEEPTKLYDEVIQKVERLLFRRVLEHTNGRQLQASQLLGIGRRRLREKLRDLGMSISRTIADDGDD